MYKRKDGRWEQQIYLPNGSKKSIYGSTKAELNAKLKLMAENESRGRTFSELLDDWWEHHEKEIEYNTREGYLRPIEDVREGLGHLHVKEITSLDIQRFITSYSAGGARARNTVKIRRSVINQAFDFGILHTQEIRINPTTPVKIPKVCSSETREPPDDRTIEVIKRSLDKTFGLFPYLLIYTGLRPGEALALRWEDIDFSRDQIHITKSLIWKAGGKPELKEPKTKYSIRQIPLLYSLKKMLPRTKKGFIFSPDPNKPISEKEYRTRIKKYKEETDLTFDPYQLRHYFATLLYEAGVEVKDAQVIMGHSKASTTMEIYTHISERQKNKAALQLEKYLQNL